MQTGPLGRFTVAGDDPRAKARILDIEERPYTVIYDGNCKVCGKVVGVLVRRDRQGVLEVVPSQAPGVHGRFPWIPLRAYAESVQVVRNTDGKTWQGAAAIEAIINAMPKGWLIGWIFKIPFIRPTAERFYRWFARNRYQLGCGAHCEYRPRDVKKGA
ncbi:MAG: thiol-disulfide oxidoreductase DCC family protein, partial [Gemmatimonadaceae bacterium]